MDIGICCEVVHQIRTFEGPPRIICSATSVFDPVHHAMHD